LRKKEEERQKWVRGEIEGREYRSEWHEERDRASHAFEHILETRPNNWQAVVSAFEKIPKVILMQILYWERIFI
jgi:hypothetical protein